MERKFYTDNFEQLLKEKSDEFRMYPSKRVWHSIYNDLHPGRKWPSVAMGMVLIIALLLIGYLNTNDNSSSTVLADTKHSAGNTNNNGNGTSLPQSNGTVNGNDQLNSGSSNETANNESGIANGQQPGSQNNNASATGDELNTLNTATGNPVAGHYNNVVASIDNYIRTNQLFTDLAAISRKKGSAKTNPSSSNSGFNNTATLTETGSSPVENNNGVSTPIYSDITKDILATNSENSIKDNKINTGGNSPGMRSNTTPSKNAVSAEEKAWMEDYALHNKSGRKKWKDRMAMELYATPSIGYRTLSSELKTDAATMALAASAGATTTKPLNQKPSLGLEAGVGLTYSVAKNIRLKAGVQVNYTSYAVKADATNHPILTTLLLNDPNTGHTFLSARTSTLSNSSGLNPITVHNQTYQVALPVGFALKLAGNSKFEWYAGATIQPSFVMAGSTHFISSDYNSYVSDPTLLRKWNMNTGMETYVNYKVGGYSLQVGPQLRYQLLSTYNNKSTTSEKLYNMGLKVGLVKGF